MEIKFKNGWWKITQDSRNYTLSHRYKLKSGELAWEPKYYYNSLKGLSGKLLEMQVLDLKEYKTIIDAVEEASNSILSKLEGYFE